MEFLEKIEENRFNDLYWNIPETKRGRINVIGGNGQSFRTPVKVAEFLNAHYPVKTVQTVLPDALAAKLPPVEGVSFLKSTDSGSFLDENELAAAFLTGDFNLLIGDLSRNSETMKAVASALQISGKTGVDGEGVNGPGGDFGRFSDDGEKKPVLVTRDAVDLIAEYQTERVLMRENLVIFGSLVQLQKLLKAVYYPKMLLLSQSLVQISEILHKFSLSYPCKIVTLVGEQILIAENGRVVAVPLEESGFSPLTLWSGEMAAKIAALNLYNPGKFIGATAAAVFQK